MPLFLILPDNDMSAATMKRRGELMPAHKEFLKKSAGRIWLAGPVRAEAGGDPVGSMWLVKAESKAEADAYFRTDPLFATRSSYKILFFDCAFPDGPVTPYP